MASKQQLREQRSRQRQKQRRTAAQAARRTKTQRARSGVSAAAAWPVTDAWISQDWYEWERVVHGVIARGHADGVAAVVAFEVDLADDGLRGVEVRVGLPSAQLSGFVADRTDRVAMVSTDPAAVARLALEGLAQRRARGLPDPKGLDDALALLGDVDPDDSPFDFRFGREGEDDVTEEAPAATGLFARFGRFFFRRAD